MLWYKGWLETRWRFAFSSAVILSFLAFFYWSGLKGPPPKHLSEALGGAVVCLAWTAAMLAGAGINTQPGFQATKGLHGSTYFTLSLPVSRRRLLLVRSSLGWLLQTAIIVVYCVGMWAVFPPLHAAATPMDMLGHMVVLVAYSSAFYSLSVLLATFLDDLWRTWGSMIVWGGLWALSNMTPLPQPANIFRAVAQDSPLLVHAMPWPAICVAVAMTLALFGVAAKIVRVREY